MPTTEPIHGSPYKLWSDGQTFSVTCAGADTATDCLFVGMALNKSSEFFGNPWLVQSHHGENSSLDTIATVLHVYGRSLHPLGQSDLEQCDSASTKLVMLDCGDGLATDSEFGELQTEYLDSDSECLFWGLMSFSLSRSDERDGAATLGVLVRLLEMRSVTRLGRVVMPSARTSALDPSCFSLALFGLSVSLAYFMRFASSMSPKDHRRLDVRAEPLPGNLWRWPCRGRRDAGTQSERCSSRL